jgi:hypothetical protein
MRRARPKTLMSRATLMGQEIPKTTIEP